MAVGKEEKKEAEEVFRGKKRGRYLSKAACKSAQGVEVWNEKETGSRNTLAVPLVKTAGWGTILGCPLRTKSSFKGGYSTQQIPTREKEERTKYD